MPGAAGYGLGGSSARLPPLLCAAMNAHPNPVFIYPTGGTDRIAATAFVRGFATTAICFAAALHVVTAIAHSVLILLKPD